LVGFAIEGHMNDGLTCWPYVSVFGVLDETGCSDAQGWAWFFATDLPRFGIMFPALALALILASIKNGLELSYLANAIPWIGYSIPLMLIAWLCLKNRRSHLWPWSVVLLLVFMAEVIHLAASE
jgi:hypothetical protein